MAEIGGVLAKIGANRCLALGRAIAFVEDQVKDLMNGVSRSNSCVASGGSSVT